MRLVERVAMAVVSLAVSLALGEGALTGDGVSVTLRASNVLERRSALDSNITAFAEKACPEQFGQCTTDKECAQEIGGLIGGAQAISEAAQALVQCVSNKMAPNRLQLRSGQSVGSSASVENFGSALSSKDTYRRRKDPIPIVK